MSFTIGDPERNRTSNWGLGIPRYIRLTTGPLGLSITAFYELFEQDFSLQFHTFLTTRETSFVIKKASHNYVLF